jgi:energy-converting hydrogenase Eha subunit E
MVLVRLLLFLSLTTVGVALALYIVKRDRRYLRFIGKVAVFTLILLLAILAMFAAQRLFGVMLGPML